MHGRARVVDQGPFRADQLRSGDPYELSHGHAIRCAPTGGSGSGPNQLGASVVGWDPQVTEAGVDTGYSPAPNMLRAPDVAVGNVPNRPGWVVGVPELAIEYADIGQDEKELASKISDLLEFGTKFVWVVRLAGPRRVEVHEAGKKVKVMSPGSVLTAPGVLKNPVPMEALYDRDAAARATLTNLLQRQGYADLEAVLAAGRQEGRQEGREEGREEGKHEGLVTAILSVLDARGIKLTKTARDRIERCTDAAQLGAWVRRAATVHKVSEMFEER